MVSTKTHTLQWQKHRKFYYNLQISKFEGFDFKNNIKDPKSI